MAITYRCHFFHNSKVKEMEQIVKMCISFSFPEALSVLLEKTKPFGWFSVHKRSLNACKSAPNSIFQMTIKTRTDKWKWHHIDLMRMAPALAFKSILWSCKTQLPIKNGLVYVGE